MSKRERKAYRYRYGTKESYRARKTNIVAGVRPFKALKYGLIQVLLGHMNTQQ